MAAYWTALKDYCDATLAPLVPSSLARALPWTAARPQTVPGGSPDTTPHPPLPSEVTLRILAFTLPAPSYTNAHERTRLLKSYALFSRDCARWATLLLRRDVACTTYSAADAFCHWIVGPAKRARSNLFVESVRYGTAGNKGSARETMAARPAAAGHVANHCPNLQELWLSEVDSLELDVLRNARALRSLYLHETRLSPPRLDSDRKHPVVFPHLATLHLSAIIASGSSLTDLLSPETLPALRHLDYVAVHQSQIPAAQQLEAVYQANPATPASVAATLARLCPDPREHPLVSLAPRLHSLAMGARAARTLSLALFTPLFAHANCLTLFSLPLSTFLSDAFPSLSLPRSLLLLRLTSEPEPPSQLGPTVLYDRERGWRSSAFRFVVPSSASDHIDNADDDDDDDDIPIEVRFEDGRARRRMYEEQRKRDEVRAGHESGVRELADVLRRDRARGARRNRYLVVPGGVCKDQAREGEYAGTGAELREVVSLDRDGEASGGGGDILVFSENPARERKDGAFRLGTERWRRFLERPCPDSLL
ncbi:hypothetical protein Rt10032_c20g6284 [Rhodotorula toruloides]|uniref:Uncharacterized protein n=1 Tax=Rhodotorula toruloides TaxID=5286 RepID=A0A511KPG7_RHOTO|nr:hypothetical protein Rt10032_c20g6284 [Rhodotorula toruloides]